MITNNKVPVNNLTNYTVMGSEIQLFCGNQTTQDPMIRAVCGENGIWSDNLNGYRCAAESDQESEFNNTLRFFPMHNGTFQFI